MEDPLCWARALVVIQASNVPFHFSGWRELCIMLHNGLSKEVLNDPGRKGCWKNACPSSQHRLHLCISYWTA